MSQTTEIRAASAIKGLAFRTASVLPRAPSSERNGNCESFVIPPIAGAGKEVAASGWSVTGEARLGPYAALSFAGHLEQETSGTCDISQGNVGIFDGTRLVALAYAPHASKLTIGKVAALEGGDVRVWSGDVLPTPLGDIHLADDRVLRLGPLAAHESLCDGGAIVPNIYGLPIDRARKALSANGWTPVKRMSLPEDEMQEQESDLAGRGIVETDGCAGTGLNFCSFKYTGRGGSLTVFTAGEWDGGKGEFPRVTSYDMKCR